MGSKFGFSWSWRRALGVSAAKARLSRRIGIPLTRPGRQRMAGRIVDCCVLFGMVGTVTAAGVLLAALP